MTTEIASSSDVPSPADLKKIALNKIISLTLNEGLINERKTQSHSSEFVIEDIALRGDITVLYASPNTGKTLLALRLLAQTKQANDTDIEIFHVNLDDSFDGLTKKAEIGLTSGYRVLNTSSFTDPLTALNGIFTTLIESGAARETVFILDTVKKFADPMDKKACTNFMRGCRTFTQAGGTIILLAHNNKQTPNNPTPTPGGTSDLHDDADCVYVMSTVRKQTIDKGTQFFVKFDNRKARGPNVTEANYSFIKNEDTDYTNMFWSVKSEESNSSKQLASDNLDPKLVDTILCILSEGPRTQAELTTQLRDKFGKNKIRDHLKALSDQSTGEPKLAESRGPKNKAIYELSQ